MLTIVWDQKTNRGETHSNFREPTTVVYPSGSFEGAVVPYPMGTSGLQGRALVDALFSFSYALGSDYSGEWSDDSTFVLTIVDATGSESSLPEVGLLNVTARPSAGITSFNYTSKTCFNLTDLLLNHYDDYQMLMYSPAGVNSSEHDCTLHYSNNTSPPLTGDLGVPTYPTLLTATLDDVDNGDSVFGSGVREMHLTPRAPAAFSRPLLTPPVRPICAKRTF